MCILFLFIQQAAVGSDEEDFKPRRGRGRGRGFGGLRGTVCLLFC